MLIYSHIAFPSHVGHNIVCFGNDEKKERDIMRLEDSLQPAEIQEVMYRVSFLRLSALLMSTGSTGKDEHTRTSEMGGGRTEKDRMAIDACGGLRSMRD